MTETINRGKYIYQRMGPIDGLIHIRQIIYLIDREEELNEYWVKVEQSFLSEKTKQNDNNNIRCR
jgi:DNA-directed RNA polymerase subunit E'/Rpb7